MNSAAAKRARGAGARPTQAITPVVTIAAIVFLAVFSAGAALALTIGAPQPHLERFASLASVFTDTWKMCVVALLGLLAGSRFK